MATIDSVTSPPYRPPPSSLTLSPNLKAPAAAAAATGPTEVAPASGEAALLTPESLLAYCSSRLHSIDAQVETIFNQQQSSSALMTAIDDVAGPLGQLTSGNLDSNSNPTIQSVETQIAAAITQAGGPTTAIGAELNGVLAGIDKGATLTQSAPGVWTVTPSANPSVDSSGVSAAAKSLQDASSDVNSEAQLNMIQLQSLISDQQTAVQLTTGIMQSFDQASGDIASNIGRS